MALRPRLSPGVLLSRCAATVGISTAAVKHWAALTAAAFGGLHSRFGDSRVLIASAAAGTSTRSSRRCFAIVGQYPAAPSLAAYVVDGRDLLRASRNR